MEALLAMLHTDVFQHVIYLSLIGTFPPDSHSPNDLCDLTTTPPTLFHCSYFVNSHAVLDRLVLALSADIYLRISLYLFVSVSLACSLSLYPST